MKKTFNFNNCPIIAIGDSITKGSNGHEVLSSNYPKWLAYYLHANVDNAGENGATITGTREIDMPQKIRSINWRNYQLAICFYGTNDYGHSKASIEDVSLTLANNINIICQANPDVKIIGILPTTRYDDYKNASDVFCKGGYTFNDLLDALKLTYQVLNIDVLDWRVWNPNLINNHNYQNKLNDCHLHPNGQTYQEIAINIANYLRNTIK
ncbi:G-D-S-L family lipolytic protein [Apilactobacillus ozensis DSM 23829 = JCM 17196]|uniref:G-D-S-L family lipolytic protein n=1 Tax=Apilactobacillus ozensis DSM 23829 = JCM 17196 TaxID=1423781 RepID=A0A0R2ALV6_9LACO|nr:SGNH/GDSL hydrolase family protein [Apilactobacillus ozensis]KRM68184.1 G-D-S-L family lipolytic protein [Apilactobacillus ozensis DSM 23829 = JCM 17196]